jgi:hypothetical protein
MSETAILFLYLDQINSLNTLISSISTPNIVIIDLNEFDIDVITDTVNNIANLQHVGFLYEHSATTNGFPLYLTNILQVVVEKNPNCIIDLLTCNLNSIAQREHIKSLENTYNITIRYSVDLTGHQDSMGNWIMESHNVSVKAIYFNETIDQWKHTLSDSTDTSLTIPEKRAQLRENGIPEWHLYPELHEFTFGHDELLNDVTMYRESANRDIKVTAKHADDTAKGLVTIELMTLQKDW